MRTASRALALVFLAASLAGCTAGSAAGATPSTCRLAVRAMTQLDDRVGLSLPTGEAKAEVRAARARAEEDGDGALADALADLLFSVPAPSKLSGLSAAEVGELGRRHRAGQAVVRERCGP